MKKKMILLLLSSCTLFKSFDVSKNLNLSTKKICLSSEGKGRLGIDDKKYIFQYESVLDLEHANWKLALNLPLQKSEIFELDWSQNNQVKFSSTIDEKILRENNRVNPTSLEFFTQSIGRLIQEIISLNNPQQLDSHGLGAELRPQSHFVWEQTKKSLFVRNRIVENKNDNFQASFSNMVGNQHFGLIKLKYTDDKKQEFKMDLILKECFL